MRLSAATCSALPSGVSYFRGRGSRERKTRQAQDDQLHASPTLPSGQRDLDLASYRIS
jgi:hypothetical protein